MSLIIIICLSSTCALLGSILNFYQRLLFVKQVYIKSTKQMNNLYMSYLIKNYVGKATISKKTSFLIYLKRILVRKNLATDTKWTFWIDNVVNMK